MRLVRQRGHDARGQSAYTTQFQGQAQPTRRSVAQDARTLVAMDSIYRIRDRDLLAVCVFALLLMGVIMVQSAAFGLSGQVGWRWSITGTRDVMFVAAAIVAFFICGRFDYRLLAQPNGWHRLKSRIAHPFGGSSSSVSLGDSPIRQWLSTPAVWIFVIAVLLCAAVLVPHIGKEVNGARRWIQLGPIQIQASELGKWGCVILFAWILSARPVDARQFRGLLLCFVPLGVVALLIVKEDFGTAALIGVCMLAVLVAGGVRLWHLGMFIPPLAVAAVYFVVREPYRLRRVMAFLNPYENPQKEGYHLIQSLLSFASGGVTGRGLGNGVQKLGYLPEDTTDFIFAMICEELGLFGAMFTIVLYLGIIWCCWNIARRARDSFGQLLAFGVGCMIGLQAMINIAVATVSVPPKGLPLPLVSFGGTGLVITCAMLGLVYNVARISGEEYGVAEDTAVAGQRGPATAVTQA